MSNTIRRALLAATIIAGSTGLASAASAQDVSVSTGVDLVTDYVFRGVSLADTAVQPYAEVSIGNFTAGTWISTGLGDTSILAGDEIDLYAGYSVPLDGPLSLDLGITYYHYPQGGSLFETEDGAAGTYEVSAAVGFNDVALAPSVAAYYDLTLEAFTLEGAIGHSVGIGEKQGLDLGLTVGLVDGDGFSYEWGQASAAVSHGFTDDVSVYAGVNYTLNSEDTLNYSKILNGDPQGDLFWGGIGISAGF